MFNRRVDRWVAGGKEGLDGSQLPQPQCRLVLRKLRHGPVPLSPQSAPVGAQAPFAAGLGTNPALLPSRAIRIPWICTVNSSCWVFHKAQFGGEGIQPGESSAPARLGGLRCTSPPNAAAAQPSRGDLSPWQTSGLGSGCQGLEPVSEPGSDSRSPSASALPLNQKKKQLRVERSQMKDVADVSPLPSSWFAMRGAMLAGPRPCCHPCHPVSRDDRHCGGRWHLPAAPGCCREISISATTGRNSPFVSCRQMFLCRII